MADFKAERRPASSRNGGRLQIVTVADFVSVYPAGINRNPQTLTIMSPKTSAQQVKTQPGIVELVDKFLEAVRQLVLIASDDLIAGLLNRNGLKTGNGNRWTRERVTSMRSNYRIPVFKAAADGIEPWLNLGNAAKLLKVAPKTLRLAAEAGEIEGVHPLSDGPWIFERSALTTSTAQSITVR